MMQQTGQRASANRQSRRSILALIAAIGAAGMLTACGGGRGDGAGVGNQGTTASTQVPAATTPQAPAAKQTLTGTATPAASPGASPAAKP